ncbi:MAG: choice-of-anchor J domain-containing protein [Prevotella sp.]|nr:choice-of-anchor J domain-containing protein [Prevotella sp.]
MKKFYKGISIAFVVSLALMMGLPVHAQSRANQRLSVTSARHQDQWAAMQAKSKEGLKGVRSLATRDIVPLRQTPQTVMQLGKAFELSKRHEKPIRMVPAADYKLPAKFYGALVYSSTWPGGSGTGKFGIYTFTADAPNDMTAVVKNDVFQSSSGAIYANGMFNIISASVWYSLVLSYDYYQYDTYDWKQVKHVNGTETRLMVADGDYDPATGNTYAIMYSDDMQYQVFGTLDYESNSRQIIKQYGESVQIVALAISPAGIVYGIRNDGNLVQIDKTTGNMTVVGQTGITPMYQQSATFDPRTGRMYWAACTQTGDNGLYELDLTTGEAMLIQKFNNSEEFAGLFIPAPQAEEDAPAAPTNLSATFTSGSLTGSVRFRMPKLTYAGEEVTDTELGFRIYLNDSLAYEGTGEVNTSVAGEVTVPERGTYRISACAVNAVGEGARVRLDKFIGPDEPTAPRNVKVVRGTEENSISLSWAAPASGGVHGGYVNTQDLNYTVIRYPDEVTVAEKLTERRFSEVLTPTQMTNYWYVVVAYNGDIEGLSAESNHLVFGDVVEIPYYEDFEDQSVVASMFTIIDANNDGFTWRAGNWNSGEKDVYYQYNENDRTIGADDWIITPPVHLQKGHFYNISFTANSSFYGDEHIGLAYGKDKTLEAMTNEILPRTLVTNMDPETFGGLVKIDEEGKYYFGFHAMSDADKGILDLDNIAIVEGGVFEAPDTVTDLTITPGAEGTSVAAIEFNAPTKDFYGNEINEIDSIVIYRGSVKRHTFVNPAPGENCYRNDTQVPTEQNVTYRIYTYNKYGHGIPAEKTVWVGVDIPDEPTDLTLTMVGRSSRLKWNAPTTGQHGGYIKPADLTYNIEDNNSYIKGTNRKGTTYTETINKTEQDFLYYRVSAQSKAGGGNYSYSNTVIVGNPYTLPFFESFANAKSEKLWSQQASGGEIGLTSGISVDGDRGCAIYKPTGAGQTGMITSGKINVSKAAHPVLEFYYYAVPRQQTTLTIGVVPDGDADNLQTVKTINYATLTGQQGWRKVVVNLDNYVSTNYILISFIGQTTGKTYGDIAFDAITVRNQFDIDLSASIDMPTYVVVGDEMRAVAQVENIGRLATADYKVQLFKNGLFLDEQPGVNVEPEATVTLPFKVPTLVTDAEKNAFEVKIVCTDDGDDSNNNASAEATYEMPLYPAPTPVGGANVDDVLTLTWKAPDLSARNVTVTDNFDQYSPFIVKGIGRWTTEDLDGQLTGVLSTSDGNVIQYDNAGEAFAYQVFNPAAIGLAGEQLATHSGEQMLINMMEVNGKANDLLISPELSGCEQIISFWVRSIGSGYIESFEVLASSESADVADFKTVESSATKAPASWTEVTATLPAGTKYFAVRVNNSQKFMLMIDDFTYTLFNTTDLNFLGYNLYWAGVRINEELITEPGFVGDWFGDGDYQVTAVYEQGESMLSEPFSIGTDGISVATTDVNAEGNVIYNLAGQRVEKAQKGIYIVNGRKVVVK